MPAALVTDSTASLSDATASSRGIIVVPLQVVIGSTAYEEGVQGGATAELVATSLLGRAPVSTSRPTPRVMLEAYAKAAAAGATEIVSIHLSSQMSGTFESAQVAARDAERDLGVSVVPLDTRQVGMSVGFAVLAAADAIEAGGDAEQAADVARRRAQATTSLFYVDTLEYLRRGGRIGAAQALVGSALSVKPILRIEDGHVLPFERVRTSAKALGRLADLAVEAASAGDASVDVAVFHLAAPERAETLAQQIRERLGDRLGGRRVHLGELGAVLGARVGPGMVAVSVAPVVPLTPS